MTEVLADDAHAPAFQRKRDRVWIRRAKALRRRLWSPLTRPLAACFHAPLVSLSAWKLQQATMKNMTIWQRLNVALVLLVFLLASCAGLTLWMAQSSAKADQDGEHLSGSKDRIYYDVTLLSEALHGLLLDPRSEFDKKRRVAESDLKTTVALVQQRFPQYPELLAAVAALQDFALGNAPASLGHFQAQVQDLALKDPAAAKEAYQAELPGGQPATRPGLSEAGRAW